MTLKQVTHTLPSLHQLLPAYACVVDDAGAEPTHLDPARIPHTDTDMARDGLAFYDQLQTAEAAKLGSADALHAIVGTNQPTTTTVRLQDGDAVLLNEYGHSDYYGDSTVPLVGAIPAGLPLDTNTVRRVPDNHGNLQRNPAALDELEGILTARPIIIKGDLQIPLSVAVPDVLTVGEPLEVTVTLPPDTRAGLHATLRTDTANPKSRNQGTTRVLRAHNGMARAVFEDLPPGSYIIDITGTGPASTVAPVSAATLVWDPTTELPNEPTR